MTPVPTAPITAGQFFHVNDGQALATAVRLLLDNLAVAPELLALGEPTHGEPAFPRLRNRILEVLVEHGFRSIALESDRVAALTVDAFVRDGAGTLDAAMAEGFSHGLGQLAANRELVAWIRAHNDSRPPAERLAFHGFDAPLEMAAPPSPGPYLRQLHGFLLRQLGPGGFPHGRADLDHLLGDDGRWSDPAALLDAGRSVGASAQAATLRVVADDLLTVLHAQAPRLVAASSTDWQRARVHGATALGLLRYHAQAADPVPAAQRTSRLLAVRDVLMAQHLLDIRDLEQHRGATLVFAHNRHLQRHLSTWRLADLDLEWYSAGAIVATRRQERYAVIAGSLGASAALGLRPPAPDTFEGAIGALTPDCALLDAVRVAALLRQQAGELRARTDGTAEQGYFPLDAATLEHCDAVLHIAAGPDGPGPAVPASGAPGSAGDRPVATAPGPAELAELILALPDVTQLQADEQSGAPRSAWGDRFFFVGSDRRRPFATIVEHDTPGFDESSDLDRPGIFRLNIQAGRDEFQRRFGYPPAEFANRRAQLDFTRLDEILPHPVYGIQGWACILNPTTRRLADVELLLAHAHRRTVDRHHRATR